MNKEMSVTDVVAQLEDGMTLGIGGWGPRRKPMALVREILRSSLFIYGGERGIRTLDRGKPIHP